MTREEVKEILPILQAYANGKTILYENGSENITDLAIGNFEKNAKRYHIKPENTYRHFANAEECWQEMLRHEPFGWIINRNTGKKHCITAIHETSNEVFIADDTWEDFYKIKKNYTFADGIPFGVKV